MPFTFGCMVVGGLALSGVPPFSGFFSKDEIIALQFAHDDWHIVLGVIGYVGSLLTAIYTFRMIFRAFYGEPNAEARELMDGHLHHAESPTNPMTGEIEDTDVGFPGPEHHIAERELPMKLAMGTLALLAIVGGIVQVPKVTDAMHTFLEPTFADSTQYARLEPSGTLTWVGLAVGAAISVLGIFIAYTLWVRRPEVPARIRVRFAPLYRLFVNKWYFDEAIDLLVVRPGSWLGRFASTTFERVVVQGALVGGATGVVGLASAAVRRVQTGYLRYYAALLLLGITSLGAYFLVSA
jgi:NADH-quinone oxidoreductase subunit L